MPTFKRKPETVDARQFTGGVQNGTDVVFWINSIAGEGVSAKWEELYGGTELIRVMYTNSVEYAFEGDWIMQRQNGAIEVVRAQMLALEYEQV